MIVKDHPGWLALLFSFRGTGLARTWWRLAVVTVLSIVLTVVWFLYYGPAGIDPDGPGPRAAVERFPLSLTPAPFAIVGIALSIFLGFRNNASYDRFWEGRRLWGQLVNVARSFTRQVTTLVVPLDGERQETRDSVHPFQRELVLRMIAYAHALRHHLRDSDPFPELQQSLSADEQVRLATQNNVPAAMLQTIGRRIQWAWQQGWIRDYHVPVLEGSLTEMTTIQGGCERIKATPLPFAYNVLLHQLVAFYCLLLPFGIVQDVGVMTPLVVLLISHAFLGLDELGDEIEEPFGTHPNDLPLTAISRTIEINLKQLIGDPDVPEPLEPVRNVLI